MSLFLFILFCIACYSISNITGSAAVGWVFFIGIPIFMIWARHLAGERTQRDREAAQIKFMDLGEDTRFEWPDDAGWLGKAVGTSHYMAALDRVNNQIGKTVEIVVLLVPEPNNPHDEHAIAVCTEDGMILGHIAKTNCRAYAKKLSKAAGKKCVASTRARVGCWMDEKTGDTGHFIRLIPNDY